MINLAILLKPLEMKKTIFVTGGAGFIGSALARYLINETEHNVINFDKLTYAGNLKSLASVNSSNRYSFIQGDICNRKLLDKVFKQYQPDYIMHLAAESHVDRSIDTPGEFIQTNITGTYELLEAARNYFFSLAKTKQASFRFHHISTDEVYGDLGDTGCFNEESPYQPSSPYSASKAASDHLVRAWFKTYGLPVIISNSSNNYGPYHYPEKLIPLIILNALEGKALPIYGNGKQVRDWVFVEDHVKALYKVVSEGVLGETYNIGGFNEKQNIEVVTTICNHLNGVITNKPKGLSDFNQLITYVKDRPGHDVRYAIDASKINQELGWYPQETFESGIKKTIEWYLANREWCKHVQADNYQQ